MGPLGGMNIGNMIGRGGRVVDSQMKKGLKKDNKEQTNERKEREEEFIKIDINSKCDHNKLEMITYPQNIVK